MVAVRLQTIPDKPSKGAPEWVSKLLEFWAAWLRGVRMPDLGVPHETPESRVAREQNGERYREEGTRRLLVIPETRGVHTLADSIGLQIDRAIEDLTFTDARMVQVIMACYFHDESAKLGCKRIRASEDEYDRLLFAARWYLTGKLEKLKKHVE